MMGLWSDKHLGDLSNNREFDWPHSVPHAVAKLGWEWRCFLRKRMYYDLHSDLSCRRFFANTILMMMILIDECIPWWWSSSLACPVDLLCNNSVGDFATLPIQHCIGARCVYELKIVPWKRVWTGGSDHDHTVFLNHPLNDHTWPLNQPFILHGLAKWSQCVRHCILNYTCERRVSHDSSDTPT